MNRNTTGALYSRLFVCLIISSFWLSPMAYAQDTVNFSSEVYESGGPIKEVRYTSGLTGARQIDKLKNGVWTDYNIDGAVLRTSTYKVDKSTRSTYLHGKMTHYNLYGEVVLIQQFNRGRLISNTCKMPILIFDGRTIIRVSEVDGRLEFSEDKSTQESATNRYKKDKEKALSQLKQFEDEIGNPSLLEPQQFTADYPKNIVTNPSFENHHKINKTIRSVGNKIPGWDEAIASPDFFLDRTSFSGSACFGFRTYSYSNDIEYVLNHLKKPLIKDSLYCFSMKLCLSPASRFAGSEMGVFFGKQKDEVNVNRTMVTPQVVFESEWLLYKSRWMTLQCVYRASGGEKYLTLGTFKEVKNLKRKEVIGNTVETYYYLDDVSLVPIRNMGSCPCTPAAHRKDTINIAPLVQGKVFILHGVQFELDKDVLLANSKDTLQNLFSILLEHPDLRIEIVGYTSDEGSLDHNLDLSQRRAFSVREYLVNQGIEISRMEYRGMGPANPIESNETEEGRSVNRRVEIKVL